MVLLGDTYPGARCTEKSIFLEIGATESRAEGPDLLLDIAATEGALLELSSAMAAVAMVSARHESAVYGSLHAHLRCKNNHADGSRDGDTRVRKLGWRSPEYACF